MGQKAKKIEAMRIRSRARKKPRRGLWIDSSSVINEFSVGDTKHAQSKCIHAKQEDNLAYPLGCLPKMGRCQCRRWPFERVVKLDKIDGPAYVLMTQHLAWDRRQMG